MLAAMSRLGREGLPAFLYPCILQGSAHSGGAPSPPGHPGGPPTGPGALVGPDPITRIPRRAQAQVHLNKVCERLPAPCLQAWTRARGCCGVQCQPQGSQSPPRTAKQTPSLVSQELLALASTPALPSCFAPRSSAPCVPVDHGGPQGAGLQKRGGSGVPAGGAARRRDSQGSGVGALPPFPRALLAQVHPTGSSSSRPHSCRQIVTLRPREAQTRAADPRGPEDPRDLW